MFVFLYVRDSCRLGQDGLLFAGSWLFFGRQDACCQSLYCLQQTRVWGVAALGGGGMGHVQSRDSGVNGNWVDQS